MKRLPILAASLVLATGALAACGGDDDEDGGGSTAPAQTGAQAPTQATGPAPATGEVKVSIKNTAYEPKNITARVGQTIRWTNDDPIAHTVTRQGGFDSGTLNAGANFTFKPTQAGRIDYLCTIHPGQTGSITVES
jgi:plastocyanin